MNIAIKKRLESTLPFAGLPILAVTLLVLRAEQIAPFILLRHELIIIFGYIAAFYDIRERRIPNKLILTMLAVWVLIIAPMLFFDTDTAISLLADSALGFVTSGALFLLVYWISRSGLGGGDVKFMAASGLYLGFGGAIPAILFGTTLAALTGMLLILLRKIGRKDPIPLAPFLYAGILITVFLQ